MTVRIQKEPVMWFSELPKTVITYMPTLCLLTDMLLANNMIALISNY